MSTAGLDSWLFGVARNVVQGHVRRWARRTPRSRHAVQTSLERLRRRVVRDLRT